MNLRDLYTMAGCSRRAPALTAARPTSSADCPREAGQQWVSRTLTVQTLAFRAATGNAFTTFFAGLALTITVLPNISFLPALVAGLVRILRRQRPGTVKTPVFFTS